MRLLLLAAAVAALTACASGPATLDATPDSSLDSVALDAGFDAIDAPVDAAFEAGAHPPFPQVPDNGGPQLAHVEIIPVLYADFPYRTEMEQYVQWIVGSSWLTTVGADYGVGSGSVPAVAELTDVAPVTITDSDIQAFLRTGVTNHTLPQPADGLSSALYVLFFPSTTTISDGGNFQSCSSFGGYHGEVRYVGGNFTYAVIALCGGLSSEEITVSHEVIEAATDPYIESNPGYDILDPTNPWAAFAGEIGDLCEGQDTVEAGNAVQRIWSNSAALAGEDPCVPNNPMLPYYTVGIDPVDPQYVDAGTTVTFAVTAWSTAPMPAWTVTATAIAGDFTPIVTLSTGRMTNGQQAVLSVRVPSSAMSGAHSDIAIVSSRAGSGDRHVWPVGIDVN